MHPDIDYSCAPPIVSRARAPFKPGGALLVPTDAYRSAPVRWLWHGRVPVGKVTLLVGDPGLGKSFVTLDLAARTSVGRASPFDPEREKSRMLGHAPERPADVVLLNAEDDPGDTIRPRLEAMGADLERIHILDGVHGYADKRWSRRGIELDRDAQRLDKALDTLTRPRLVVIDPISAFMGKTDSHSNAQVRALLADLSAIAARHDCAIVCVSHLNKAGAGQRAVYRAMGSLAFTAAARVVLLVAKHPDDPGLRVVAPVKCNLGAEAQAIGYRIVEHTSGAGVEVGLRWEDDPIELAADDLERDPDPHAKGQLNEAIDEACAWLEGLLEAGPVAASEVHERAREEGLPAHILRKARAKLGVKLARQNTTGGERGSGRWDWTLPTGHGAS